MGLSSYNILIGDFFCDKFNFAHLLIRKIFRAKQDFCNYIVEHLQSTQESLKIYTKLLPKTFPHVSIEVFGKTLLSLPGKPLMLLTFSCANWNLFKKYCPCCHQSLIRLSTNKSQRNTIMITLHCSQLLSLIKIVMSHISTLRIQLRKSNATLNSRI